MLPLPRVRLFALTLLLAAVAGVVLSQGVSRADGGVPIPAPAGTTWSVVAGYNTGTHAEHDGQDPHAIDIVRVPREETAFTPVLAPVSGTVAWRGWDGLSITDSAGFDHLLAHVAPLDHIQRGSLVRVGDQVATVCAAYDCGNHGLPHIHYAVHQSNGDGYLGPSVPFTGRYALEGRELPWRDEYNLYAGSSSLPPTSSIGRRPRTLVPLTTSAHRPSTNPSPNRNRPGRSPADAPVGGWRMIGVHRDSSVAGLFANLNAPLSELVVRNPYLDTYHRFDPSDEASAPIAVQSLKAGQALWALVLPGERWLPAPPAVAKQVTIQLNQGRNLISWQGPDRHVADALGSIAHLSHAYRYDPYAGDWRFWSPDGPDFLRTLTALKSGDALYIVVRVGSIWTQLP